MTYKLKLEDEVAMLEETFQEIISVYTIHNPKGNFELIRRAYKFAKEAHNGMRRRSGEPYIIHPLSVALIIAKELQMGATTIASAFLHDVVEDTDYTVEDIEIHFGDRVATMVEGLTKLSGKIFDDEMGSLQADNFRKLLMTMSKDFRVILVKIADRLHNMRTLGSMPADKQYKISAETLYIYAPLAHRLGMFEIKTELENLSFKYKNADTFNSISEQVQLTANDRDIIFDEFVTPIEERLQALNFNFKILKRLKPIYSIWKKMESQHIPLEEVYDLMATRIIFEPKEGIDEKQQCWQIYGEITSLYKLKDNRVRDWISSPKSNNYEALHLTVMGPKGQFIEVQIRSTRMNEIAEIGYAAHWKYKTDETAETELDRWVSSVTEQLKRPDSNSIEFLENFRLNLYNSEIFVFTPKGKVIRLPRGASVLDFAYDIHTELGTHCIGAKVNRKLVAASHVLSGGDQIEVLTSTKQFPQLQWKNFTVTAHARNKIKFYFKKKREVDVKKGKSMLREALDLQKLEHTPRLTRKLLEHYQSSSLEDLYQGFANNIYQLDSTALPNIIKKRSENKIAKYWNLTVRRKKNDESTEEFLDSPAIEAEIAYTAATCCYPVPGDDIIGYRENNSKEIKIHRRSCKEAIRLMSQYGNKMVNVKWDGQEYPSFLVAIELKGIDRIALVAQITWLISNDGGVNMRSVHFDVQDSLFQGIIEIYVHHMNNANNLIGKLLDIEGVKSVRRIEKQYENTH